MFRRLRYFFEFHGAGRSVDVPPPAERTWVHPSELPGSFEQAVLPPRRTFGSRRFNTVVASAAAALLLTGGALLAEPAGTQLAGAATGPKVASTVSALPAQDRLAGRSMLALVIFEGQHVGYATAMVLAPGDIAITTTPIPRGASVMGRVHGHASMPLKVLGTDRQLGATVLHLPTAERTVTPIGALEPAVSTGGAPTRLTALAAVRGATTPVEFEYAPAYLEASAAAATLGHSVISVTHGKSLVGVIAGSVILDADGNAVAVSAPSLGSNSFVSAAFLQQLAQRIVLGSAAGHGWLQLEGTSPSGPATIATVIYEGASWGKVRPGDTLIEINSVPVRSMADVGTLLYTSSPDEPMNLTLLRNGHRVDVVVVLADSP